MSAPMVAGTTYTGSIRLAVACQTVSQDVNGNLDFGNTGLWGINETDNACELQIWGGTGPCQGPGNTYVEGTEPVGIYRNMAPIDPGNPTGRTEELLWQSGDVLTANGGCDIWQQFSYTVTPSDNWSWILIRIQSTDGTLVIGTDADGNPFHVMDYE